MPWRTLKGNVGHQVSENTGVEKGMAADIPKLGQPFTLPKFVELRLVKYLNEMQKIGLGLNVSHRELIFQLSTLV